jgi:membrane associated rhomboid family serine protease
MGIYDREYYRGESRGVGWFAGTSPVCRTLILINVVVYLLANFGVVNEGHLRDWFAATGQGVFHEGKVWQLLTATFLHAGPLHLIGNMLILWLAGREMESMYGPRDFLALYLSAGVVSTLAWALFDLSSPSHFPMVGASGAVTAVMVVFALYFPRRELLFMFVVPIEVWLLVVLFVGYNVLLLLKGGDGVTAFESHLAGAAYGFLYKRFDLRWSKLPFPWSRVRRPRFRVIAPEPRERPAPRPSAAPGPGPSWSNEPASASAAKPAATAVLPEEQLDARLDEVLAKIAREGRAGLTDEENRVLQEASRRARNRRSERL